MSEQVPVSIENVFDGVAGAELPNLESWVLEWFRVNLKGHFKTIDRWRGQVNGDGAMRTSFQAPALFVSIIGTVGDTETSGGRVVPSVKFGAAIVTRATGSESSSRYSEAVAKSGVMWRALTVMNPERGSSWKRPSRIQFKNQYTKKIDEKGLAIFGFQWIHEMSIGDIDITQLADLAVLFGRIFPDDPSQTTLATEGEVIFPTDDE